MYYLAIQEVKSSKQVSLGGNPGVSTARLFSGHSEENPLPSLSSSWKPPTFVGPFPELFRPATRNVHSVLFFPVTASYTELSVTSSFHGYGLS